MARPNKQGLDYFPLDVDFLEDEKMLAISGEFAVKGEIITLRILCEIYRNGYFVEYSGLLKNKLARLGGLSGGLVEEVVKKLVEYNFFNGEVFREHNVLTSKGIQKRYLEAVKRRKNVDFSQYWLLKNINVNINNGSSGVNVNINPQSKVKEKKEKNDDDEKGKKSPSPPSSNFDDSYFAIEVLAKEYLQDTKTVDAVVKNKANKFKDKFHLKEMLIKFVYHLMENSVKTKTKADFASHFRNWNRKQPPETEEEKQLQKQDLIDNF